MEIGAKRAKLAAMVHESRSFLSRRTLCAAPFLLTARHALAADADPDVVIVGAGAAGLSAAHAARAAGLRFVVVEARSRIGGRTVTDIRLGAPFDGGATFIHFADKNPWTGIAAAARDRDAGGQLAARRLPRIPRRSSSLRRMPGMACGRAATSSGNWPKILISLMINPLHGW
jgi:NADPH-dependent 2,4-dienoyl-CoA reductase/sulfur reductase-like enzyme